MKSSSREAGDPGPAPGELKLSGFLPYRLNVMATLVSEGLGRVYGERFGIGIPEWRVLATVGEFQSITAKAIGAHAHMGKVKVSRAATALEEKRLIRRVSNPADLREAFLVLTPEGRRIYAEVVPLALAYVADLTEGLDETERAILDTLVTRLTIRAASLRRGQSDAAPVAEAGDRRGVS